ncbi:MAG: hypothetical protein Q7R47_04140 [Candidatus Diapherotrites archaeon]|nr:hypothetical protein [Candidatus Diapherotrites archaeon]
MGENEHLGMVSRKTDQLVHDLIAASQKLGELEVLQKQLSAVQQDLNELKEYQTQFPESLAIIQRLFQEKQVYRWFHTVKKQGQYGHRLFEQSLEDHVHQTVYLENNRTYRYYQFNNHDDLLAFLSETAFLFDIKEYHFKPNYMGLVNFDPLEQNGVLSRVSNDTWKIPADKINELAGYLYQQKSPISFRLEHDQIRIQFKTLSQLKIDAPNAILKRLDVSAKTKNAQVIEN